MTSPHISCWQEMGVLEAKEDFEAAAKAARLAAPKRVQRKARAEAPQVEARRSGRPRAKVHTVKPPILKSTDASLETQWRAVFVVDAMQMGCC